MLALTSLLFISTVLADPSPRPQAPFIPPSAEFKSRVAFWIDIYGKYSTRQGVIHDSKNIDRVYEVIDVPEGGPASRRKAIRDALKRWKDTLVSVHQKQSTPEKMNEAEKRVFEMFKDIDEPNKFLAATHRKRIRFQLGQKDRFQEGLYESGRYLPLMEAEFKKAGLPVELTRLPFVESSFNVKARSKVGASGIWQFMRSTGKQYMRISDALDERNDPIRATEAAARKLKFNHEALGNWALAVTAYNHGRQGIMRAVRKVGSDDLETLIKSYKSRLWGFASSNFYACLLAALEVERNAEQYFGKVPRAASLAYYEVEIPDYIQWQHLEKFLRIDTSVVRELNPGLTDLVYAGRRRVPAGYRLRLPADPKLGEGAAQVFLAGYTEIPSLYKYRAQSGFGAPPRRRRQ